MSEILLSDRLEIARDASRASGNDYLTRMLNEWIVYAMALEAEAHPARANREENERADRAKARLALDRVVRFCESGARLREENDELREKLAAAERDKNDMRDELDDAEAELKRRESSGQWAVTRAGMSCGLAVGLASRINSDPLLNGEYEAVWLIAPKEGGGA